MNSIKIVILVLIVEIWGLAGQVFFKKYINTVETPDLRDLSSYIRFIQKIIAKPIIWLGIGCVTVSILIWLTALAQADLSMVYPMESLQYILALIFAGFFLREKIDGMKILGTFLIIFGIILISVH